MSAPTADERDIMAFQALAKQVKASFLPLPAGSGNDNAQGKPGASLSVSVSASVPVSVSVSVFDLDSVSVSVSVSVSGFDSDSVSVSRARAHGGGASEPGAASVLPHTVGVLALPDDSQQPDEQRPLPGAVAASDEPERSCSGELRCAALTHRAGGARRVFALPLFSL